jgi:drug/metabolite transporter (DMT)-like permease
MFGDQVGWLAIIFLVIIVIACSFLGVSNKNSKAHKVGGGAKQSNYKRGISWLICTIVFVTVASMTSRNLADKNIDTVFISLVTTIVALTLALTFGFVSARKRKVSYSGMLRSAWTNWVVMILGSLYILRMLVFFSVITLMNIGVLQAITQAATAFIVIIGVIAFKEKLKWHGYIAVGVVIASSIVLALIGAS